MKISRRTFIGSTLGAGLAGLRSADASAGVARAGLEALAQTPQAASTLARRFPDLTRHFIFEYYAWYGMNPVEHWDQDDRRPPIDIASNYMPRLGAYDSRSRKVMEQHAKWIKESGAGAINLSWWGPGSDADKLVPTLMDVMVAYDIKIAFHLEPYRPHHALAYADDIEYLIRRYGDARRWDGFLLLKNDDGRSGPVFKSFRTIVPPTVTDCRGRTFAVEDYADDAVRRTQTDRVRRTFASDFDHVTLLADSLDVHRTRAGGFDGIAVYDNYVTPSTWRPHAEACTENSLVFSFNVNPGFNGIVRRRVEPDSCYVPPAVEPAGAAYDWTRSRDLTLAALASERRIRESFATTLALQTEPGLANVRRGFFLAYLNSFNEWHEGHQFEPMRDAGDLSREERAVGYHNPEDGGSRLRTLKKLLAPVLAGR